VGILIVVSEISNVSQVSNLSSFNGQMILLQVQTGYQSDPRSRDLLEGAFTVTTVEIRGGNDHTAGDDFAER
jgi:hypothetical protein